MSNSQMARENTPSKHKLRKLYQTYNYDPLANTAGNIRNLTLCPSLFLIRINVFIHIAPFTTADKPIYEALSYT
jgi:hypothetical protein